MYEDKKINYIFIVQNKKLEKFINCTMNIIFKSVLIEAVPYDNIIYQISFSYRTHMYIHIYDWNKYYFYDYICFKILKNIFSIQQLFKK